VGRSFCVRLGVVWDITGTRRIVYPDLGFIDLDSIIYFYNTSKYHKTSIWFL
jgi:hypothetical protein